MILFLSSLMKVDDFPFKNMFCQSQMLNMYNECNKKSSHLPPKHHSLNDFTSSFKNLKVTFFHSKTKIPRNQQTSSTSKNYAYDNKCCEDKVKYVGKR